MRLFDDEEPVRATRTQSDWEQHRVHRSPGAGPPQDEIGVLGLASFLLARTPEVAVAVRGITAYSDGLRLSVVVLFADEQKAEDVEWALRDFSRSPGRFRLGCAFSDGRRATTGRSDAPEVDTPGGRAPHLVLLSSHVTALTWSGEYWLWPLPSDGPLVVGCRWPDRRVPETLVQVDAGAILAAAASSRPVWDDA
ncbi:MAG TPA: hypothetical protein VNU26_12165 [Mycobacteriales bacterium]|nr:hypothetical protein [Mycobacteriales bacterium]